LEGTLKKSAAPQPVSDATARRRAPFESREESVHSLVSKFKGTDAEMPRAAPPSRAASFAGAHFTRASESIMQHGSATSIRWANVDVLFVWCVLPHILLKNFCRPLTSIRSLRTHAALADMVSAKNMSREMQTSIVELRTIEDGVMPSSDVRSAHGSGSP
jgi:hypothetical protein